MKKINLLALFLVACNFTPNVDVTFKELKYNEVMGYKYSDFEGRLFSISCKSYGSSDLVDGKCLEKASEIAFNKGYSYFTIKKQDKGYKETQRTISTSKAIILNGQTSYIPSTETYTETTYHNNFDFILIDEDEISKYDNYYIVDDYFPPKANRVAIK